MNGTWPYCSIQPWQILLSVKRFLVQTSIQCLRISWLHLWPSKKLKEIVHPKMKNLSWFTQPHVVPNQFDSPSYVEHKMRGLVESPCCCFSYNECKTGADTVKLHKQHRKLRTDWICYNLRKNLICATTYSVYALLHATFIIIFLAKLFLCEHCLHFYTLLIQISFIVISVFALALLAHKTILQMTFIYRFIIII